MPEIVLVDEFDGEIERHNVQPGEHLAGAMMYLWPGGFPNQSLFVMSSEKGLMTDMDVCTTIMEDGQLYTVALRPQAFLAAPIIAGFFLTWGQVILTAATLLVNHLARPDIPKIGEQYQWEDSDRPQFFSGQSNQFRPGSRVPECFGLMRVWPDLIAEPYTFYDGDSQIVEEMYVVSNGFCDVADPRLYDEGLGALPSTSITVYHPGQQWPSDYPIMRSNSFVGAVELPGPNETPTSTIDVEIVDHNTIFVDSPGFFDDLTGYTGPFSLMWDGYQDTYRDVMWYQVISVSSDGKTLDMLPAPTNYQSLQAETISNGTFQLRTIRRGHLTGDGFPRLIPTSGWINTSLGMAGGITNTRYDKDQGELMSGTGVATYNDVLYKFEERNMEFQNYPGGWGYRYTQTRRNGWSNQFHFVEWATTGHRPGGGFASSIFTIPGKSQNFAFDIEFPTGLYQQDAGKTPKRRAVVIEFHFRRRDIDDDPWKTLAFEYGDLTRVTRRFTTQLGWAGIGDAYNDPTGGSYPNPGNQPHGEYECYFRRVTDWEADTNDTVTADACRIIGLRGRQDISGTDLDGDVLTGTMVRLRLSTQNLAQVAQSRNFNVLAQRHLPDYLNNQPNARVPTREMAPAIMYTLLNDIGEGSVWDISEIDVDSLNAIQSDLNAVSAEYGQFNGIIDQTMTAEDQILMICGNQRVMAYRRASITHFRRLKAGEIPRSLINARNKEEPEQRTLNFSMKNEPDAIILRFRDEDDEYREGTVQYPAGATPINPSEQSVIGITKAFEVQRLAQYLWDKRKFERDTCTVPMTDDGVLLAPGDLVAVTDHLTVEKPLDGEVIEDLGGGGFRVDQPIPDGTYIARLRDKFGELYAQEQHIVSNGNGMDGTVAPTGWQGVEFPSSVNSQVGLLYSFTPLTDESAELFYVTDVAPQRDGPTSVNLLRYSDETFQSDDNTNIQVVKAKKKWRPRRGD